MAKINIIVPEATRNLITNPSVEKDTTDWTAANGAALSRSVERARFGVASLKIITPNVVPLEGAFFRINPASANTHYVASVYLRGEGLVRIRLKDGFNGDERVSDAASLNDVRWTRFDILGRTGPVTSNDLRLYIETDTTQGVTLYADGAQIEEKGELTDYCDGDQEGCRWDIIANQSESVRDAEIRTKGIRRTLAEIDEERDVYVTTISGFGMAPIRQQIQEFAIATGGFFQRTKVLSRVLNMVFWVKDKLAKDKAEIALTKLHELRQTLIDQVKPDAVKGGQPFTLEYEENEIALAIQARYEVGLEFSGDLRNKWANSFPLRLIATDPYWKEDNQEVAELDLQDTINPVNFAAARESGTWNNLNFGFDDIVREIEEDSDGRIYFGGDFTTVNNDATAIDPLLTANRICYWDGAQFRAMGAGFNGRVRALGVAPDGTVWAGGDFTDLGGAAAGAFNRVAFWDWATETWNNIPIGANNGLNATVLDFGFLDNGDVIIVGGFSADGAGNTYNNIVRWDGSSLHAIGANNGTNNQVNVVVLDNENNYGYIGGNFTAEFGGVANTFNYVGRFDTTNFLFELMSGSSIPSSVPTAGSAEAQQMLNNNVNALAVDSGNNIYAGGTFDDVYLGTSNDKQAALWNGGAWIALPDTDNIFSSWSRIDDIAVDLQGLVYWGGFTGVAQPQLGIWNGSVWINPDIFLTNVLDVFAVLISNLDNVYLGTSGAGFATISGITTVSNIGTAAVNPIVRIEGPCTVRWLENQTADKRLFLDAELQENELVTIDFDNKLITTTFRGKAFTVLRSNSDFGSWNLLPGENTIALFVTDDVEAQALIRYVPRHWSVDAVGA